MTATTPQIYSGSLAAAADAILFEAPSDPAVGENHGFWFFEDGGAFTFHVHLEANCPFWAIRREMVHVLFADGRAMTDWQFGMGTTEKGPGSACTRTAEIIPFGQWQFDYAGFPLSGPGDHMAAAIVDLERAERVPVEVSLDIRMGADPWVQGQLTTGGMSEDAKASIGGFRHEQLCRASGTMRVGDERRAVSGTGLRTHRIGARTMTHFAGHSWLTALFPSGRGFGFQRQFLPDGSVMFNEGFIIGANGGLVPVEVIDVPAMTTRFSGDRFRTVLGYEGKEIVIDVESVAIHHWTRQYGDGRNRMRFGVDLSEPNSLVLNNGCARVIWDGEVGYGLLERSSLAGKLG